MKVSSPTTGLPGNSLKIYTFLQLPVSGLLFQSRNCGVCSDVWSMWDGIEENAMVSVKKVLFILQIISVMDIQTAVDFTRFIIILYSYYLISYFTNIFFKKVNMKFLKQEF